MTDAQHTDRADDAGLGAMPDLPAPAIYDPGRFGAAWSMPQVHAYAREYAARTAALTTPAGGAEGMAAILRDQATDPARRLRPAPTPPAVAAGGLTWRNPAPNAAPVSAPTGAEVRYAGHGPGGILSGVVAAQAALVQPAAPATGAREVPSWGAYARAACEAEGGSWVALDNTPEDCARWFSIGRACAALTAGGAGE